MTTGFKALVLAGSRGGAEPVAAYAGVAHKALIRLEGQTLLARVVNALRAAGASDIAVISSHMEVQIESSRLGARTLPEAAGPSLSVQAAARALGTPLLVTTADHALLEPAWVERFIADTPPDVDVAVLVAARPTVEAAAPTTKRTWLKLADGDWSGCNLFWLANDRALGVIDLWRRVEAERKRPWKMAWILGPGMLLRFVTRRLSLRGAAERLGALAGMRAGIVETPYGLASVDVDKPADLDLVRAVVSQRAGEPRRGFHLPARIAEVEGSLAPWGEDAYPLSGFLRFDDFELGNGDSFGLYWPLGQEDREPLVMETLHDNAAMAPAYSSLARFLDLTAGLEGYPDRPALDDDPESPLACLHAAKKALADQSVDLAIELLRRALARLPEYTAALALLSTQLVRIGDHDEACRLAVRAVRSPPCLALDADAPRTWRWLSQQESGPADLQDDPIWLRRKALAKPPAGGSKHNDVYLVLMAALDDYDARGDVIAALCLLQSYGELMRLETTAFQDRYGFSLKTYRERRLALERRLPNGRRSL